MSISSGFGAKYGRKVKQRYDKVASKYKFNDQVCPFCSYKSAKRLASGIYECSKCSKKFAGGAYEPETEAGKLAKASILKGASE